MSFGFDLNEKTNEQVLSSGNVRFLKEEDQPSMFDGFLSSAATSIPQGFADLAKSGSVLLGAFPAAYDAAKSKITGETESNAADWWFKNVTEDVAQDAVNYWAPDASQTGSAGKVANSIVRTLTQATTGVLGVATSVGVNESANLVEQGVDSDTAMAAGGVNALATYAGFRLPFLGNSLLQKMSFGAGSNLAMNTASTAAEKNILESSGYTKIAEQYNPWDVQARMIDVLTGVAFGAVAHVAVGGKTKQLQETDLSPTDKAAVFTANNAKHFEQDTAPGIPADPLSSAAHQDALATAINQLSRGEPVDLNAVRNIETASYVPKSKQTVSADEVGLNVVDDELDSLSSALRGKDVDGPLLPENEASLAKPTAEPKPESTMLQTPEYTEAKTLLESYGDLMVNLEDGDNIRSVRASDLLKEIEKEAKTIEADSKAFDAAINCYLGEA